MRSKQQHKARPHNNANHSASRQLLFVKNSASTHSPNGERKTAKEKRRKKNGERKTAKEKRRKKNGERKTAKKNGERKTAKEKRRKKNGERKRRFSHQRPYRIRASASRVCDKNFKIIFQRAMMAQFHAASTCGAILESQMQKRAASTCGKYLQRAFDKINSIEGGQNFWPHPINTATVMFKVCR